jgi:hypothetical protein
MDGVLTDDELEELERLLPQMDYSNAELLIVSCSVSGGADAPKRISGHGTTPEEAIANAKTHLKPGWCLGRCQPKFMRTHDGDEIRWP